MTLVGAEFVNFKWTGFVRSIEGSWNYQVEMVLKWCKFLDMSTVRCFLLPFQPILLEQMPSTVWASDPFCVFWVLEGELLVDHRVTDVPPECRQDGDGQLDPNEILGVWEPIKNREENDGMGESMNHGQSRGMYYCFFCHFFSLPFWRRRFSHDKDLFLIKAVNRLKTHFWSW